MRRSLLAAALALALAPGALPAQVQPQPGTGDPRVQTVDYDPDQVVLLQAAPGYQVTLEFGDERIENVAVGDSGSWQVTANRRGDFLFVKPLQAAPTNMTVVTDSRVYLFELSPIYGADAGMAYTVRFRYPAPEGAAAEEETAQGGPDDAPQGRYRLSGARSLRPSAISDDGVHTYIEWPAERTLPAVYTVDGQGRESLVNGAMRDEVFVIDEVVRRLVFRIDDREARAERVAPRAQQ
ncbi:MAG TPA: TrbG/VirB9 family P-type conjugative transfer protein [Allosphingosinicella sp.]|nr:TrbG/VirB9 family P-type conjugative transfer protein [Allosphingosinicella sp.]